MSSSVTSSSGGVGGGGGGWGLDFYDCVINNDLERLESLVERHKIDLDAKFTEVRKKNHLDLSPIHLVAYKVRVIRWLAVRSFVLQDSCKPREGGWDFKLHLSPAPLGDLC